MTDIFTLGLKADTTDIDKGAKSLDNIADSAAGADKKTGQMREGVNAAGKAIAAFGITTVAALGAITVSAGDAAREITNLSRLANQSVEDFQRTAFAARAYGVEQDKLTDILKDTQDKVGDFLTTGAGPMVDFFEKIAPRVGITADNFRNLNGKDALQLYVSSLEKANVSQSEMVFFMEAIASDATLLQPLLANNGEEFQRLAERADQLGIVLDELDITNLNDMKTSLGELSAISEATSNVIGATLAPFVTDLTDRFNDNATSADTVRESITTLIEAGVTVAGVYADAGRVFEIFGKALAATAFSLVEQFDTMDVRLEQLGVSFELTFDELQLSLIEWVNEQDEELARWATSVVNAADVFDIFDDIVIEPQPLDTSALEESISMLKEQAAGLETDLALSNENIANAWQDVIDTMLQPLPSEGMDKWVASIIKGVEAQRDLQKEIKKTGAGNNKIVASAASDAVKWISNTKEVTKGLGTAFGENEKLAKRLHQVNTIIGIAEQAMILQKVFADSAATQTHIANSTAKASANAVEAVTAAAAAPFPVGFAAAAAMIGLMASVLGSFSGGGSASYDPTADRQETQGTGTVLGSSDKSQSIINAQERFEDLSIDQLAELREIRDSNNLIAAGIGELTKTVVVSGIGDFGGELGEVQRSFAGFSSTKKKVIDEGIQFIGQTLGDIIEGGIVSANAFFDIETKKSSFFGLSKSTSTKTEFGDIDNAIQQQMADIFGFIGDTVLLSAESLGIETVDIIRSTFVGPLTMEDFAEFGRGFGGRFRETFETVTVGLEEALGEFQVDIGKISLEGLSGEEIQEELAAVFSQQADLIAEFLVPSIAEYQKVGEGLFDTLLRVTKEQAIFNDSIAQMGMDLSELSSVMQIDVAQSIIELIGGAERFSDLTGEFFNEFFSEAEQFEQLTMSLTEAVEGLGLSMFDSRDDFRDMVEGLDLTTEAGQALFAALLELVPSMDEYFDTLENDAAELAADAERELEEARRAEAEAAREAAAATRELERAASSAFSELGRAIKTAQTELKAQLKTDLSEVQGIFDAHREAVRDNADSQVSLIEDQIAGIRTRDELSEAAETAFSRLAQSISVEQEALSTKSAKNLASIEASFDARRQAVKTRMDQQISSMSAQLDIVNGQVSALTSLSGLLESAITQVVGLGRSQARNIVQDAIDAARSGKSLAGVDVSGAVSSLTNIEPEQFGSALDLQKERARTANQLGELKDLTDGQLSAAERNIVLLESQIETVRRSAERQIEALDVAQEEAEAAENVRFDAEMAASEQVLANAREQLDALLGIDTGVLSLEEAQEHLAAALAELSGADANDALVEALNLEIEEINNSADRQIEALALLQAEEEAAAQARFDEEFANLEETLENAREQLDALLGIDTSIKSLIEAEAMFADALTAALADQATAQQTAVNDLNDTIKKRWWPGDTPPIIMQPLPPVVSFTGAGGKATDAGGDGFTNDDIMKSIAISSAKTAKLLDRWDGDGQPEIRDVS